MHTGSWQQSLGTFTRDRRCRPSQGTSTPGKEKAGEVSKEAAAHLGAPADDDGRVAPAERHLGMSLADAVGAAARQRFRGLPGV